jgi:hypothetical protein
MPVEGDVAAHISVMASRLSSTTASANWRSGFDQRQRVLLGFLLRTAEVPADPLLMGCRRSSEVLTFRFDFNRRIYSRSVRFS